MFNILKVSQDINPKNYSVKEDGKLEIEWSEGDHTSHYDPKWLRKIVILLKISNHMYHPINFGTIH